MRIGIVADIHDAVGPLRRALSLLRERDVDHVVTLGDAFDSFQPGAPSSEVAALLREAGAVGVWGNHDVGLSHEVTEQIRAGADQALLKFAARLKPQLVLEGCRFSHIEPWKDPRRLEDLWGSSQVPDTAEGARRSFEAVLERIIFVGHFHSWLAMSSKGRIDWDGIGSITLSEPDRYLVVVSAVADGWCAMFETGQSTLVPIRCA
jgi:predicted phosphodiesterase